MQDAQEVMDLLLKVQMQQGEMDADDPQLQFVEDGGSEISISMYRVHCMKIAAWKN